MNNEQSIDSLVTETLLSVDVPVKRLRYTGKADEYITFQRLRRDGTAFADDEETNRTHHYAADIFSKNDFIPLLEKVEQALKAAGFEDFSIETEMYEPDTGYNYVPVEFYYYESMEE